MNQETAKKVIEILLSADGGCVFCASELIKLFVLQFPEYKDLAGELFKSKFESDIELPEEIKQEGIKLYGWDDGKIYFWDGEKEICVSDEEELYNYLVKICTEYFTR